MNNQNSTKSNILAISSIIADSLEHKTPDKEFVESLNMDEIYSICAKNDITAFVGSALISSKAENVKKFPYWEQAKMRAVYKSSLLEKEFAEIEQFLKEQEIWYMPLKGSIIKELYPIPEYREMADIDVLFDSRYSQKLKEFFVLRGYDVKNFGITNVDEYMKEPCFNFEMHRMLYPKTQEDFYNYYENVFEKLIPVEGSNLQYRFSDEDFYVFLVSHLYKHFKLAGTGIRSFIDIYLFLKEKESLDFEYIAQQTEILKIKDFEKYTREFVQLIFSGGFSADALKEEQKDLLYYIFESGTYGNEKNYYQNLVKRFTDNSFSAHESSIGYWFKRAFDMNWYKANKPFLYKTKVLIPFHVVFRLLRSLTHLSDLKKEEEALKNSKGINE